MILPEQLDQLEKILGKCLRLCAWIEFQITEIYAFDKTKNMPIGLYLNEDLSICKDKKVAEEFEKALEKCENDSFNTALKRLVEEDENNIYFSKKQYKTLDSIRKLRNDVFHNSMCLYLDWKYYDGKEIDEYNTDLKKAKKLASLTEQYKGLISRKIENNLKKFLNKNS